MSRDNDLLDQIIATAKLLKRANNRLSEITDASEEVEAALNVATADIERLNRELDDLEAPDIVSSLARKTR